MDSNMTFRIDSEVKAQMAAICDALGMSTSTAFNIFANAWNVSTRYLKGSYFQGKLDRLVDVQDQ